PPPATDADNVWRAPLVPAALALTSGILVERFAAPPLTFTLAFGAAGLLAWLATQAGPRQGLALVYLALTGAALGAAWYHLRRDDFAADDVGNLAPDEPRPVQ